MRTRPLHRQFAHQLARVAGQPLCLVDENHHRQRLRVREHRQERVRDLDRAGRCVQFDSESARSRRTPGEIGIPARRPRRKTMARRAPSSGRGRVQRRSPTWSSRIRRAPRARRRRAPRSHAPVAPAQCAPPPRDDRALPPSPVLSSPPRNNPTSHRSRGGSLLPSSCTRRRVPGSWRAVLGRDVRLSIGLTVAACVRARFRSIRETVVSHAER